MITLCHSYYGFEKPEYDYWDEPNHYSYENFIEMLYLKNIRNIIRRLDLSYMPDDFLYTIEKKHCYQMLVKCQHLSVDAYKANKCKVAEFYERFFEALIDVRDLATRYLLEIKRIPREFSNTIKYNRTLELQENKFATIFIKTLINLQ